jgi:hypothetical protein
VHCAGLGLFFMLSGFGPAYARLLRAPGPQAPSSCGEQLLALLPAPRVLVRRLVAVYPAYLVAALAGLAVSFAPWQTMLQPPRCIRPDFVALELLLLQCYVPVSIKASGVAIDLPAGAHAPPEYRFGDGCPESGRMFELNNPAYDAWKRTPVASAPSYAELPPLRFVLLLCLCTSVGT